MISMRGCLNHDFQDYADKQDGGSTFLMVILKILPNHGSDNTGADKELALWRFFPDPAWAVKNKTK